MQKSIGIDSVSLATAIVAMMELLAAEDWAVQSRMLCAVGGRKDRERGPAGKGHRRG